MRHIVGILALSLLAGCAGEPEPTSPVEGIRELVVPIPLTGQPARSLVEGLAAHCWLGLVGGANMIVDRATGRVLVVSDSEDLLVAEMLPDQPGEGRVRFSGPALAEPGTSVRLVETLDAAVKSGQTSCPAATG